MPQIERKKKALTVSAETVYTVPVANTAVVQNILVANIDGTSSASVDVWWTDAEDSDARVDLAYSTGVAASDTLVVAETLHLKAGDTLKAQASADGDLMLTANILEFSA
jgi:hypothetical protein